MADAEISYRVVPFPNDTLRAEMLATARRVAVPEAFLRWLSPRDALITGIGLVSCLGEGSTRTGQR